MTSRPIRPEGIASTVANYAHAVLSETSGQILHTAAVVPVLPDGTVPEGLAEQASTVWANILAILFEASMGPANVVSITTYVIGIGDSGRRTLSSSLILEQTGEEFRGRVMGVYAMNFGLIPLGALPLGFIAALFDVRIAFAIAGGTLFVAMVGFATLTNRIRQL